MHWSHVQPNSINLAYLFLGAFTSVFILFSGVIKNRMYLGEANIAFLAGIILGPRAANVFDPTAWHNPDAVILECTRVVLVIQCFAVAVQLRKRYVEREWRSLAFMLLPVMVWGWIISSVGIYVMDQSLSWKECLACAACFNAIDPILAATVINGKAAERVPQHLRDLLLAESACNDITTTLALELATYAVQYAKSPRTVAFRFFALSLGYEVLFGAVAGLMIGTAAHWAVKKAMNRDTMDRPSFLSFYFVLALFCTGFGVLLGVDEVLLGFCAGYAFDIDDWFQDETEESEISNVIDLLLNLSFFVLLGSIIPWQSYNTPSQGIVPWRFVLGTMIILLFRRLPVVLLLQSFIPATEDWREGLLVGHFGPIGGGAIFSALVIKIQLESGGSRGDVSKISQDGPFDRLTASIWPIVTFVVLCSSIMHGTTVPAFLLGRQVTWLGITIGSDNESISGLLARFPKISASSPLRRTRSSSLTDPSVRRGFFSVREPEAAVLGRDHSHGHVLRFESMEATPKAVPSNRLRAYRYDRTIVVENEAGQVLKRWKVQEDDGPSTLHRVKSMVHGRQVPKPPQVIISEPNSKTRPVHSPDGLSAGQHGLDDEVFMQQLRDQYPNVQVQIAKNVGRKTCLTQESEGEPCLQVSPSANFFLQERRRRVSFEDEQEENRSSFRSSINNPSRTPSASGSFLGHDLLKPPPPTAQPEAGLWR